MNQRGNILFLILLAVVLFAALSYAVTQSLRGGGKDASGEKSKAQAAALIQRATLIEQTVMRMMLVKNVPFLQLSFPTQYSTLGANSACVTDTCNIFHVSGGGASDQDIPPSARTPNSRTNQMSFALAQVNNVGTDLDDLVMAFIDLNEETCKQINDILGISNSNNGLPPNDDWDSVTGWFGNMATYTEQTVNSFSDTALVGHRSFCARMAYSLTPAQSATSEPAYGVTAGNIPMYYFIHVLVAR